MNNKKFHVHFCNSDGNNNVISDYKHLTLQAQYTVEVQSKYDRVEFVTLIYRHYNKNSLLQYSICNIP